MGFLGSIPKSRSLESLRKDLLHTITHTTEGLYFQPGCTLLGDKEADKEAMAALCPQEEFKASDKGITHLTKLFVQSNKWLPVFEMLDSKTYWAVVAFSTSEIQGITISPETAKALVLSFLKARQLWILRQDDADAAKSKVKTHLAAGVQRLLECFEQHSEDLACLGESGMDEDWQLTDKQIEDACKERMGPGKRVSKSKIALSWKAPHPLVPIGQISSTPQLENSPLNPLGMLESSVAEITPAEAVQALLSPQMQEFLRDDDAQSNSSKTFSLGRRVAFKLPPRVQPTWLKKNVFDNVFNKNVGKRAQSEVPKGQGKGKAIAEASKRARTVEAEALKRGRTAEASPTRKARADADAKFPFTKKRFTTHELPDSAAKKQVVAKGTARSVSSPVSSPLAPAQQAQASRSASLHESKASKK